jgi:hypothetical protein
MTKGEYRVGLTFNPSGLTDVHAIKHACADLIDLIENILSSGSDPRQVQEVARLKAHAQTLVEDACRAAVAAATKPAPEA